MVIAASWYLTAYEHSSGVKIGFNPYDSSPDPQSGGAITLNGQYDLPASPTKPTQIFTEMTHDLGNAPQFQPIPPSWWTTGKWTPGQSVNPVTLQLNLDQFEPDTYDRTVTLGLTSWDGAAQATRSSESGGVATTLLAVINKIATSSGVPFTANADITTGPYAGLIWPQLQGVIADVLKSIAGGLGVNIYYTPGLTNVGVLGAAQPVVRLINAVHTKRKIVRPQFVPEVQVTNYRTTRVTNKVIYKAPDVIQVTSGQDQDIVVQLQGTPIFGTLVQPTVVAGITPIPYLGPASPYCVYDSDGFEAHVPWTRYGGKVTVSAGSAPDELNIHVRAPFDPANPSAIYSISELDNPALYITCGDAVQTNPQTLTFGTGAITTSTQFRPADYVDPLLDNKLIVNLNIALCRGVAYIAQESAPVLTIDDVQFDNAVLRDPVTGVETAVDPATMAASKFKAHGAYYRFTNLQFTQPGAFNGAALECTTAQDFDNEFGLLTLLEYGAYLAAEYPDGAVPSFGTGPGQLPVGTPMDSGLAALVAPTLEQWAMEPLRTGS